MKYEPIPGQPQHATEEETMSMIRSVLTEDDPVVPSRKAARALATDASGSFMQRTSAPHPRRRADDLPELQAATAPEKAPARKMRLPGVVSGGVNLARSIIGRLRAFRPTTRHLALVSMALLIALRPHWFVISGVLFVALIVGSFLIVGSDRIWRFVTAHLARVDARDPARAVVLRARLDRFACRWDAILDRLPDGMVDGLYMPDLQAMQDSDAAHTKAMAARLERMAHDI